MLVGERALTMLSTPPPPALLLSLATALSLHLFFSAAWAGLSGVYSGLLSPAELLSLDESSSSGLLSPAELLSLSSSSSTFSSSSDSLLSGVRGGDGVRCGLGVRKGDESEEVESVSGLGVRG